jgi:uncharacterized protein (DUF58 family)
MLLGAALVIALSAQRATQRGDTLAGAILALASLFLATVAGVISIPRLARNIDLSRWHLPWSFRITRAGGIHLLIIFILSSAAINTGNNLLFLILATMLACIIVSGLVARSSLRSVSISMQVPENVFEGERVTIKVSLHNQKVLIPSFSITVEDTAAESQRSSSTLSRMTFWKRRRRASIEGTRSKAVLQHPAYFPFVPPRETRTELVFQSFPRRGRYRLEGYQLSTRFPFGMFQRGERFKADGEVVVYPSLREISAIFHLLPFMPGALEGQQVGKGESLYSIRRYQEGESARIVDWKATAKTGEVMAREYAREEENRFCLILDTRFYEPERPEFSDKFEKAVTFAASLAAHFSREGAELEFLTPMEYQPRGSGIQQLYRILKMLALAEYETVPRESDFDLIRTLSTNLDQERLKDILSNKTFKVIITASPRGSLPSMIWRSSHVIYFDEL